jgi:hypothetical protein
MDGSAGYSPSCGEAEDGEVDMDMLGVRARRRRIGVTLA